MMRKGMYMANAAMLLPDLEAVMPSLKSCCRRFQRRPAAKASFDWIDGNVYPFTRRACVG